MRRRWWVVGAVLFLAGYFVHAFPGHRNAAVVAVATNVLIAWPSFAAVLRWQGVRRGAALLAGLGVYAYAIESIGVLTGVPYGRFAYGDGLGPMLPWQVPILLPLAYVPLILGTVGVLLVCRVRTGAVWVALGALVLTAFDLVLDPGAVAVGYWQYMGGGAYYGVPFSNFAGWFLTGALAMTIAGIGLRGRTDRPGREQGGLVTSAWLVLVFWTGIGFWFQLAVPAVLGALWVAALPWLAHRE